MLRARQIISVQLLDGARDPKELAVTAAEAIEDAINSDELLDRILGCLDALVAVSLAALQPE